MNAAALASTLIENEADAVSASDLFRIPAWHEERWVFTEQEIRNPRDCKRTDELVSSVFPLADEDSEDDTNPVHVIVLRDGTVTDRDVDGNPVTTDSQARADMEEDLYQPRTEEIADYWRDVLVDEHGNFVKFGKL